MKRVRRKEYVGVKIRPIEEFAITNPDLSLRKLFKLAQEQGIVVRTDSGADAPSWGTFSRIAQEARRRRRPVSDDLPLIPWGEEWPEEPEGIGCLFRLMGTLVVGPVPRVADNLTVRHGKWIVKLHRLFDLDDFGQCFDLVQIAREYADRERAAEALQELVPRTADLDTELRYRPWASDDRDEAYQQAIFSGAVDDPGAWRYSFEVMARAFPEKAKNRIRTIMKELQLVRGRPGKKGTRTSVKGNQADVWSRSLYIGNLELRLREAISGPHGQSAAGDLLPEVRELINEEEV